MEKRSMTIPEIMLIAGTRVALGAGIGLLLSNRLNRDQGTAAGWGLFLVGAVTTVPLVLGVVSKPGSTSVASETTRAA